MTMSEAAKIVLSEEGQPLHVNDLVREIEERSLFKFGAKNPSSVLSGALNKKPETFIRVAAGTYSLK